MKYGWVLLVGFLVSVNCMGQPINPSFIKLQVQLKNSRADSNRVNLLLQLSREFIFKQGELTADLDSALQLANQATLLSRSLRYDTGLGNSYLNIAQALREKGDKLTGRQYAIKAIAVFTKSGNRSKQAEIYTELAHSYWINKSEIPIKIAYSEKALALLHQLNEKKREADLLKEIADLQQIKGDYARALAQLREALAIYQTINEQDLTGIYDLLGFVSTKLGDFKEGLKYGLLAVSRTEQYNDTGLLACTVYNRVGLTYYAMGQYKLAYSYFKTSFRLAKKNNYTPSIIQVGGNISTVLVSLGQAEKALAQLTSMAHQHPPKEGGTRIHLATCFVDVYRELNQYGLAQRYCDQALALSEKYGWESVGQIAMYQTLIQFYIASNQYTKATHYLAINESLCRKQQAPVELSKNYLLRFQLDTSLHHYPLAIIHYQRFTALKDSLFTEARSLQMAQLQVQFALQKKDHDLILKEQNIRLLTNQSTLQKNQLLQAATARKGILAGAILLALLLGVSYNRYRLKQRSNHLLEAKQIEINHKNQSLEQVLLEKDELLEQKEWMLREIHHRVKNNLQIVSSMLNAQLEFLAEPAALSAIRESQNRVHAMALIHQKLYQSNSLAHVNMEGYIHDIVEYLIESFDRPHSVRASLAVSALELDVRLATPVGLIINEAVTNALKYAFPNSRPGLLTIGLGAVAEQTYLLTIADDGVGLPPGYDVTRNNTLGLTMIRGLSRQIGGQVQIKNGQQGVNISLQFSLPRQVSPV